MTKIVGLSFTKYVGFVAEDIDSGQALMKSEGNGKNIKKKTETNQIRIMKTKIRIIKTNG